MSTTTDQEIEQAVENEINEGKLPVDWKVPEQEGEPIDPSEMDELRRKHLERVEQLESELQDLENKYSDAKAEAILAKKAYEAKVGELRKLIKRGPSRQKELNFQDGVEATQPQVDERHQQWLDLPITDALSLTKKQLEKLTEAGIKTVADFERVRAGTDEYPDGLRSIKGVGEKAVDKWEEEILEHWDQWQKG